MELEAGKSRAAYVEVTNGWRFTSACLRDFVRCLDRGTSYMALLYCYMHTELPTELLATLVGTRDQRFAETRPNI